MSTAEADPTDRLDLWEDHVLRTCGNLQLLADRDSFTGGSVATSVLGNTRVSVITADPHTVVRPKRAAIREDGHIYVATPVRGTIRLSQDDTDVVVKAGDVVSFDSARPYTLEMPDRFELVAVRAHHHALGLNPGSTGKLTAAPWRGTNGVGALASRTFAALGEHLREVDEPALELLGATVNGLISTLFAERLRSCVVDPIVARQLLMLRIRSFAKDHLSDITLSPSVLAKRYNISLRYLQMLFAEQGTSPAKWIRDQRLGRLHADLTDTRYDHLTVASIGERWGLVGASQVSRLFRIKYGLTPSEVRRTSRRPEAA